MAARVSQLTIPSILSFLHMSGSGINSPESTAKRAKRLVSSDSRLYRLFMSV